MGDVIKLALVTTDEARDLDEDLMPLHGALRDAGAEPHIVAWDDAKVDWSNYSLVLLRSTWDYTMRLPEFLAWTQRVALLSTLCNPVEIVRWNTDKHYLRDLADVGIPIVSSFFLEPLDDPAILPQYDEFVVKPAVGAGSRDAQRYVRAERVTAIAHARRLLDEGRSVLVQPYLHSVDDYGETALVFFAGRFSHAIRKGPLLQRGAAATRALFAPEHIIPRIPNSEERALAERVVAAIPMLDRINSPSTGPQSRPLLYARVDLILDSDGSPCLLELELTEPSLFFAQAPNAVERFVAAILDLARSGGA